MAKTKFVCESCGYETGKWYGKCPECNSWNTLTEVVLEDKKGQYSTFSSKTSLVPQKIGAIKSIKEKRLYLHFEELNRVMGGSDLPSGGGIVPGSVTLISGDPGVGKSTLLLQVALFLSQEGKKVLYVTGEESETQVKMRAERIMGSEKLQKHELFITSTTDIDSVLVLAHSKRPDLLIIDSIQTMQTSGLSGFPGSIPQIRYCTSRLVALAKREQIPVIMIGHVTKEGMVAGPMLLSHMVDTVLYLEGELMTGTRILRSFKNRFGDTSEVGIFIMEEKGMVELKDASLFFTNKNNQSSPGSCLTVIMEGSRPLLIEIQALSVPSTLSFPRRVSTGISEKRLELLLAVIQKHAKISIERMDIFVNVVGGLKIQETASDLAVAMAIISSFKNMALKTSAFIAEIGLLGELKHVVNLEKRIKEANKFGAKNVITAKNAKSLSEAIKLI